MKFSLPSRNHHPSIIREYDIRGVVGVTLLAEDIYAIGRSFASIAAEQFGRKVRLMAGRDGRLSSPELYEALLAGMKDAGAQVQAIGLCPTPMLYFSVYHADADGGIMLTGSHNPKQHNGTKLMLGRAPFYGESLKQMAARAAAGEWASGQGELQHVDLRDAYVQRLLTCTKPLSGLRLAWDAGNGATGESVERLVSALPACEMLTLYTEVDGEFPNHHPDPSLPENMADLAAVVQAEVCHLGFAFDGDGDRLGVVDDAGRVVSPDHLLMLLARAVLEETAGARIIADVKTSQMVFDAIQAQGGEALMWMTGHSHIKRKMKEIGAAFAGEASGHLFFADRYDGYDDGLYAALRLAEWVARQPEPLSAIIDRLPTRFSTPELRLEIEESHKFAAIDTIRAMLDAAGADYIGIDGVRLHTADGWWLIRASNTQPALIARAESESMQGLARLTETLKGYLASVGVQLPASAHP
jgi:phosphomannomutase